MNHDDNDDDALARIDLHAWQVPPPVASRRAAILDRALSPAAPPRRSRTAWLFAALAVSNVLLAALLVIVIWQRPAQPNARPLPMGGPAPQSEELLRTLEDQRREVQRKLAEIDQMATAIESLSRQVRECQQDRTVRPTPAPQPTPSPQPRPPAPTEAAELRGCDEVSCVLSNHEGECCARLRGVAYTPRPKTSHLPDTLSRTTITAGIAHVRASVMGCGRDVTAKVTVRAQVYVAPKGSVDRVVIQSTPEPALGACVAAAVQKAMFDPTQRGGSFSYPFVFNAAP